MKKILSIVVPAYNVEKYLDEILPTYISNKLGGKIEVIIVNDGSKDNTSKIAHEYSKKYSNIFKVVDKENGGHGSTINTGIKVATGKYTRIIDGDDWVDTKLLEKLVNYIENNQVDTDVILNPHNWVYEGTEKVEKISSHALEHTKIYRFTEISDDIERMYQMHGINIKTEVLSKIPQITENCFYVDTQFMVYPIKYIDTVMFLDFSVYQYRYGTTEQSMSMKNQQKNLYMLVKVLDSIIEYNKEVKDEKKKKFINGKIARISAKICKIQMSYGLKKDTYNNWIKYYNNFKLNVGIRNELTKKELALMNAGKIKFYMLALVYNLKLKLEKRL